MRKKNWAVVTVTCCVCKTSIQAKATSPAAPMLSALELLAPKGWTFAVDFYSMTTGDHRSVCPTCTTRIREEAKSND